MVFFEFDQLLEFFECIVFWFIVKGVKVKLVICVFYKLGMGIVYVVEEENCDIIVMGYVGKFVKFVIFNLLE